MAPVVGSWWFYAAGFLLYGCGNAHGCLLPMSCAELVGRSVGGATLTDGEYLLGGAGCVPVQVYCVDMAGNTPTEYLTLTEDNYSENTDQASGYTIFTKIRINLASMKIVTDDYRFATLTSGTHLQPYISAAACTNGVSRATFRADITGTGLIFSSLARLVLYGNRAVAGASYGNPVVITGSCDGNCGGCHLKDNVDHHLELNPATHTLLDIPTVPETSEHTQDLRHVFAGNSELELPKVLSSSSHEYIFSTYMKFNMAVKTTLKLVTKTVNVPCSVGPQFKVAVVTSDVAVPLIHLALCMMDPAQSENDACYWLITCTCTQPSVPCILRMTSFSDGLGVAGKPWKVKKLGPVWAQ